MAAHHQLKENYEGSNICLVKTNDLKPICRPNMANYAGKCVHICIKEKKVEHDPKLNIDREEWCLLGCYSVWLL
jgi:hypothetical protein